MDFSEPAHHMRSRSRSPEKNYPYPDADIYHTAKMDYRDRSPAHGEHFAEPSHHYAVPADQDRYVDTRDAVRVPSVQPASDQARRVYVGNLSYDVKWHHLKDYMRQAGDVVYADVLLLPNGMSKGCGIVEYRTSEDAQRSIQMLSNQSLMGRLIYVREDREAESRLGTAPGPGFKSRDRAYALVSELPDGTTWRELKAFFMSTHNVPVESVGFVDAVTHTAVVELQPQFLTSFVESFNNIMYKGKCQLRVERTNAPVNNGNFGGSRFNQYGAPGAVPGGDNFGMMRPQYVTSGGTNTPLTENATSGGDTSNRIFVGNLPWATTREDLQELFVTIGRVDDTGIVYNRAGRSCGSGVVEFGSHEDAAEAIKRFDGYSYGKRPLHLSFVKYQAPNIPLGPLSMNMY